MFIIYVAAGTESKLDATTTQHIRMRMEKKSISIESASKSNVD